MRHILMPVLMLAVITLALLETRAADDKDTPKKSAPKPLSPQQMSELLKSSPEEFLRRFDKNDDGVLTKDEFPPELVRYFEKADTNGDGKLDKKEIEAMLAAVRQNSGQAKPAQPSEADIDRFVAGLLAQFDKNNDGKLSKAEAQGPRLAQSFDRLDTNKDGYLDRSELRPFAVQILTAPQSGGFPGRPPAGFGREGPDFDALDKNADGRLTRDELKGTPFLEAFDQIDSNSDGKIDRKEFTAYLKKQAEKKGP